MLLGCDWTYAPFCVSQFPLNLLKSSRIVATYRPGSPILQGPCVPTSVLLSVSWWQRYHENRSEWRSSTATPLTTPTHNHIHVLILMIYEYFCTCSILNEGGIMSNVHVLSICLNSACCKGVKLWLPVFCPPIKFNVKVEQ